MTRSGIKRGLAISAVSALSVVGLPAAAHAASFGAGTYTVKLDRVGSGDVDAYGNATYKVTVLKNGASAGAGDVSINLSEAAAAGGSSLAASTYFNAATSAGALAVSADGDTDANYEGATTVTTGTDGTATFTVAAINTGSVVVSAKTVGGTSNTYSDTFKVAGGKTGANSVAKIVTESSVSAYADDFDGTYGAFDVNLKDSDGHAILDAGATSGKVWYELTKPDGTKEAPSQAGIVPGTDADPATLTAATSPMFDLYLANGSTKPAVGNYSVKFWVDQTPTSGTATTGGYDNGEPTASTSITIAAAPSVPVTGAAATVAAPETDTTTTPGTTYLPADGVGGTTTVTLQTTTGSATASVGTKIAVELHSSVVGSALNKADRLILTTDSNGRVSFPVTYTKEDAANGETITFDAYVSGSSDKGAGDGPLTVDNDIIKFANRLETLKVPTAEQVAVGGNVSVPVKLTDQFGKGYAETLQWSLGTTRNTTPDGFPVQFSTNANGQATINYADKGTGTATGDVVTVSDYAAGGAAVVAPQTVSVSFLTNLTADANQSSGVNNVPAAAANGTPAYTDVVGAGLTQASKETAANELTYVVHLKNSDGTDLTNSPVKFTAAGGILVDANDPSNFGVGSVTANTNASGDATVRLTAVAAGKVTVSATAGNFKKTFNPIAFLAGAPYNVSLVSGPDSIAPGTTQKFVYKVTDAFGNSVSEPVNAASPNWYLGTDGVVGGTGLNADVFTPMFFASTASATDPGAVVNTSGVDASSEFSVTFVSAENETGKGNIVVTGNTAAEINPAALPYPAAVQNALKAVLKSHTDGTKGLSTAYEVKKPAVVTPPVVTPPATHEVAVKSAKGHSQGKKDVLVVRVANANGKRVVVRVHGHKVGTAVVKHGKAVIKVRDHNGKKKTNYKVIVAGVKKALKVK